MIENLVLRAKTKVHNVEMVWECQNNTNVPAVM